MECRGVLRSAHYPPRIDSQATDQHELDICLDQAAQQLIEGRLAQVLRAAPTKAINLWLRAMPSARLTLSGFP